MTLPSFLKKGFDFFVFSSLFIACCALLMVYQTAVLFHFRQDTALAGFVFFGSVSSYNFHWFLTPPGSSNPSKKIAWNLSNKRLHLVLALAGIAAAGIFGIMLMEHWIWLGLISLATFLYSAPMISHPFFIRLRKIAIGKTIYLAMVWTLITTFLPLIMHYGYMGPAQWIFFINRFFFIYAICILFDYRDVESDRKAGIRSLITFLSAKGINALFWISMGIVWITLVLLRQDIEDVFLLALLFPTLILALLYKRSKTDFSDYLYYFVLDGLMMLSAPFIVLAKFAS